MRKWTILTLGVLLTACKPTAEKVPVDPEAAPPPPAAEAQADSSVTSTIAVSLDGEGLRFIDTESGRTSLLAFGVSRVQADEALVRIAGKANERGANKECEAGPMEFTRYGAMTLNFQNDKFVGWYLGNEQGSSAYSTMSGIAVGTTRTEASKSVTIIDVEGSTLGNEFRIGKGPSTIGGMFDERGNGAKIVSLFAGTNCFFR